MLDNWSEKAASDDSDLWKAMTDQDLDNPVQTNKEDTTRPGTKTGPACDKSQSKDKIRKKREVTVSKRRTNAKATNSRKTRIQNECEYGQDVSRDNRNMTFEIIPSGTGYYGSLETIANRLNMKIVDVANDGNCLFASVCYQLEGITNLRMTATELRRKLGIYMEQYPEHYRDFVCARIAVPDDHDDCENVPRDTEQPTDRDIVIDRIQDAPTRSEIRWVEYLDRLGYGTQWGEHISLQAIADYYLLKIIVHRPGLDMPVTVQSRNDTLHEFHLGLIRQQHYVIFVLIGPRIG